MTTFTMRPAVLVALSLSALLTLLGPFVAALVWKRRTGARWAHFGAGALTFFVSQIVLRLPWQVPLGLWLGPRLSGNVPAQIGWAAASALTAALFEEVGRWVAFRWLVKGARAPRDGAMFGLGHGGIESTLLVGITLSVSAALYALVGTGHGVGLPPEALDKLGSLDLLSASAGAVERILTIPIHVALSMIVLRCFERGRNLWLAVAIAGHFALDFLGVLGAHALTGATGSPMMGELAIAPFAALAVFVGWRLMREDRSSGRSAPGVQE